MKKVLIIDGHPNADSLCYSLAQAYKLGAEESGAETKIIRIAELEFNPNLQHGYQKRMELESDLQDAISKIKWCDHIVWIHPVWWGGFPAIMKGFIDRVFLSGITYKPIDGSWKWEKLLKGKTGRIITTLDQPSFFYKIYFKAPSVNQLKKCVLQFCGVNPVKVTYIGIVKSSDVNQRKKWIDSVHHMGSMFK